MALDFLEFFVRHVEGFFVAAVVIAVVTQLHHVDEAFRTFRKTYRARTSKL
jgi:hypothetical protein